MSPEAGARFGSWRLEGQIAVGGLGEVWRAVRAGGSGGSGGEPAAGGEPAVALKLLHPHLARVPEACELFANEQRLATGLPAHPGVVRGLEAGEIDGRMYLAMELAPGAPLRRLVGTDAADGAPGVSLARLPRDRTMAIVAAAAEAAAHLHAHGWVHGDLSPGNLIVGEAARVVVVDLGVARSVGEGGPVRGTDAYMAPEQVRGGAWTPATDVFALGVVLWELAAGARLFHREAPWLSQAAVVELEPPPLADPALDAIARAALAKDPARRLGDAGELAARLRAR
jgi:serine/threonine-protein kinase